MALTRAYEENEVSPEIARVYGDIRDALDLPFVPTLFKLSAGVPEYLRVAWADLDAVARSQEFEFAACTLQEHVRALVVSGGWAFPDHENAIAAQKFDATDGQLLSGVAAIFARSLAQMMVLSRLLQRGYSGGQKGRVSGGKRPAALARMLELRVPNEREAGIRAWLIYGDIKRTTGSKSVPSVFRLLSPFPAYLAATWMQSKRVLSQPEFVGAAVDLDDRCRELIARMPVDDHRNQAGKRVTGQQWREIEATVDGFTRTLPQFAMLAGVWQRSFPQQSSILARAS
jgi:hypothetical protein